MSEGTEADYTFSGGAVLSVHGEVLTATGVYEGEKDGEVLPCVKIRIGRNPRVQVFEGDVLSLSDGTQLKIAALVPGSNPRDPGKIHLNTL